MGTTFVKERLDSTDLSLYFYKFDRDDYRIRNFKNNNSQTIHSEKEKFEYIKKIIRLTVVDDISNLVDVNFTAIDEDSMFYLFLKEVYLRAIRFNPILKYTEDIKITGPVTEDESVNEENFSSSYGNIFEIQKSLKKMIIGQDFVIDEICKELIKREIGLHNPTKPPSYFLLGQTGVGKTYFVECLSEALFGRRDKMLIVNCSKYSQDHEIANLIGAPKGYVGSSDKGIFNKQIQKHPDSIILFDEIEKASTKLFELLLPILDKGEITDNEGNLIDFDRSMIFFTSNIGCDGEIKKEFEGYLDLSLDDYKGKKKDYRDYIYAVIKKAFAPEYINRLKDIFVFNYLKPKDINRILKNEIIAVNKRLKKNRMSFKLTDKAFKELGKACYSDQYGARELERTVDRLITNPLAESIYTKEIRSGSKIKIDYKAKKFILK